MVRRTFILLAALCATFAQAQERLQDLIYLKQNGSAFTLDVFKPAKPNGMTVIWIVSGGWFSSHDMINATMAPIFTDRGITLVQAVHGSQPKFTVPEIVVQLRQAIRYVRTNATKFAIDPARIGVAGASAGGHLSLMLAGAPAKAEPDSTNPLNKVGSEVSAVVAYFPPTDFANWGKENYSPLEEAQMGVFLPALGISKSTPKDQLATMARQLSPITYVTPQFPPTLLVHGDSDKLVPVQQSRVMDAAFAKAKVPHDLVVVAGAGHDGTVMIPTVAKVVSWFETHLAKKG